MAIKNVEHFLRQVGLSSDVKPTTVPAGSTFYELDTQTNYVFNGSTWIVGAPPGAAGAYDANGALKTAQQSAGAAISTTNPLPVAERLIVAAAAAMTRPANTTAYSANDAVSNSATPGSVTPISFTVPNVNNAPVALERCRILTTDTGPGAAPATFRAWFFNSDPTLSSGVGGGDNLAWSQKQAGYIGSMSGSFRAFSDGSAAVLIPDEGPLMVTLPSSGGQLLYALIQTLGSWTPSANSTTFSLVLESVQGVS